MPVRTKHINEWVVDVMRYSGGATGTIAFAMNPFGGYLSSAIIGCANATTSGTLTCSSIILAPLVKTNGSRVLNFGTAADIVTFTFGSAITIADATNGLSVELGTADIDIPVVGANTRYPLAGPTVIAVNLSGTVSSGTMYLGRFIFSRISGRY